MGQRKFFLFYVPTLIVSDKNTELSTKDKIGRVNIYTEQEKSYCDRDDDDSTLYVIQQNVD